MMGDGVSDFGVSIKGEEVVAAALPLQEHWLPLSNLDLLLPPLDFSVFFCYHRPNSTINKFSSFASMVNVLKKAMAEALVPFYALGGELVPNSLGEPEILCNNRGVDFVQAYADIDLDDLLLYNPDATVEGKLVPRKKNGVLSVQATELRCGGVVVAITLDHRIADAHSANMFLVAWAEFAQEKQLVSLYPSFRRSLINPRRPAQYHDDLDKMYVPISMAPPPPTEQVVHDDDDDVTISRIYYIAAEHMDQLQTKASGSINNIIINGSSSLSSSNNITRSKLVSFSAFLWQIVAKGAGDKAKSCKMGIVVDGRRKLMIDKTCSGSCTSDSNYFGNVLSIPYGELGIEELKTKPLSWVAEAVSEFLEPATSKEHFLELIDWVEAHRPEAFLTRVYCTQSNDEVAFVVSSGQRFPVSSIDFGWGKPDFGSYHFPWGGRTGYVMPMPSPKENGDWIVYIHLLKQHLDFLEAEAGHVFRPFTSQYLSSTS